IRHLILALIVLGLVAVPTQRSRGKKSGGDNRAGRPSAPPAVRGVVSSASGNGRAIAQEPDAWLLPAP
ncbi:MAG: hypothetical protein NZO58_04105, partial [Gemmataceae bacterium]|nr:hypothetical protein [Gemmataceae bacterium]